ncbi:hypothetical protein CLV59_11322 [Chitinophaga dinghuensis]|uniref:Histidine kinase/HSP90-like ATPase domain-containing protein n=1 Tax=Chitinophaga dinghuensis TaxID=1539050 RepID=A0A327VKU0_9BACT|nr:ATP-binding protein [Chitinophaga dinghuensis]RAJ73470.1 hypothetical protein CLV59_11322 [Chitinophaga dinghuensis]
MESQQETVTDSLPEKNCTREQLVMDICSIADYCSTAFYHHRRKAEQQRRSLTTSFFPKGSIYTDTARLDLVLEKVFSNAITSAPIDSNIHMEVTFFAGQLTIIITHNTCEHFPENRLQEIFQPADSTSLYSCQQTIQLLGGAISASCTSSTCSIAIRLPAV